MFVKVASITALALSVIATSNDAFAQESASEHTDELAAHQPSDGAHRGLYARFMTGAAYSSVSSDGMSFTGAALVVPLSLGGFVLPNLALHGDFTLSSMTNPQMRLNGSKMDPDVEFKVNQGLIGGGATLYLPMDFLVSASGGAATMAIQAESIGVNASTKLGYGGQLAAGKEWFVGNRSFGLGVLAYTSFMTAKDSEAFEGEVLTIDGFSAGLNFSLSYNPGAKPRPRALQATR